MKGTIEKGAIMNMDKKIKNALDECIDKLGNEFYDGEKPHIFCSVMASVCFQAAVYLLLRLDEPQEVKSSLADLADLVFSTIKDVEERTDKSLH